MSAHTQSEPPTVGGAAPSGVPPRAKRPGWERFSPLRIAAGAVVVFLFAPLLVVLITSFSNADTLSFPPEGFSLRWYGEVWSFLTNAPDFKEGMARSLLFSLLLGVGVCIINIVIGVPASYAIVRGSRWNAFLDIFVSMPLVVPLVVVGIAMLVLAKELGVSALPRVIMGHVVITLPFMVRNCVAALHGVPYSVEEAATMLGASRLRVLTRIVMPVMAPGILAGIILVFSVSFNEITATIFLYSAEIKPFPMWLSEYMSFRLNPAVAAMMSLLLVFNLGVLFLLDRVMGVQRVVL